MTTTTVPCTRPNRRDDHYADECTEHGWVAVGANRLRPAYRKGSGPVVYSPPNAGAWVDAPAAIAASWLRQYSPCDGWQPFVVPAGFRIIS